MKTFVFLCLSVVLAAKAAGCDDLGGNGAPQTVALTEADNGKTIELRLGQQIMITLASNPTTGYSWKNGSSEGHIIVQVGEPVFAVDPACKGLTGCGGAERFCFKAAQRGTAQIRLIYQRPWEAAEAAVKAFEVKVIIG